MEIWAKHCRHWVWFPGPVTTVNQLDQSSWCPVTGQRLVVQDSSAAAGLRDGYGGHLVLRVERSQRSWSCGKENINQDLGSRVVALKETCPRRHSACGC